MKGSKTKIKEGSYRLRYCYKGVNHSRNVKAKNDREADSLLAEFIIEVEKGSYLNLNYTFYEFSFIWLKEVVKPNCSPIVLNKYISYLNNRILPAIGHYKINEITVLMLRSFFNNLKNEKTMYTNRENHYLSKGTIEKIIEITTSVFQNAYLMNIIKENPCTKAKKGIKLNDIPSEINKKEKISYLDIKNYKKMLEGLKNEAIQRRALGEIAVKMGMRASEIYALQESDIDFKSKTISINKSRHYVKGMGNIIRPTKTIKSKRIITYPASLENTLKALVSYSKENEFLFDGISLSGISAWFKKFQKRNEIAPTIRFHDLRHTHATLLLGKGIDLKTISERLGHNNISTTMDIYADVLKELERESANVIDTI